jgi:hypothetical protein
MPQLSNDEVRVIKHHLMVLNLDEYFTPVSVVFEHRIMQKKLNPLNHTDRRSDHLFDVFMSRHSKPRRQYHLNFSNPYLVHAMPELFGLPRQPIEHPQIWDGLGALLKSYEGFFKSKNVKEDPAKVLAALLCLNAVPDSTFIDIDDLLDYFGHDLSFEQMILFAKHKVNAEDVRSYKSLPLLWLKEMSKDLTLFV